MAFLSTARPSRLEPRGRNRSLVEMAGDHRVRTESRKHTRVAEGGRGGGPRHMQNARRTHAESTNAAALTYARTHSRFHPSWPTPGGRKRAEWSSATTGGAWASVCASIGTRAGGRLPSLLGMPRRGVGRAGLTVCSTRRRALSPVARPCSRCAHAHARMHVCMQPTNKHAGLSLVTHGSGAGRRGEAGARRWLLP